MAFCRNCGNEQADSASFCPICGTKKEEVQTSFQNPQQIPPPIQQNFQQQTPPLVKKEKRKSWVPKPIEQAIYVIIGLNLCINILRLIIPSDEVSEPLAVPESVSPESSYAQSSTNSKESSQGELEAYFLELYEIGLELGCHLLYISNCYESVEILLTGDSIDAIKQELSKLQKMNVPDELAEGHYEDLRKFEQWGDLTVGLYDIWCEFVLSTEASEQDRLLTELKRQQTDLLNFFDEISANSDDTTEKEMDRVLGEGSYALWESRMDSRYLEIWEHYESMLYLLDLPYSQWLK